MLTDDERTQADRILGGDLEPRSACIEILRIVQNHRQWIDDQSVRDVAEYLDVSAAAVESVATFYNLLFRRKVGRHVVFVCESVSCWLLGGDQTRQAVERAAGARRGSTSADGRFTVLPIQCLGACDRAPVLLVDDDLHVHVHEDAVDSTLEGYE